MDLTSLNFQASRGMCQQEFSREVYRFGTGQFPQCRAHRLLKVEHCSGYRSVDSDGERRHGRDSHPPGLMHAVYGEMFLCPSGNQVAGDQCLAGS